MHITHPHLLLNVVHIHLRIDLQELVSSAGEIRPPSRHLQLSVVGVPGNKEQRKGLSSCFFSPSGVYMITLRLPCLVSAELYPVLAKLVQ